MTASIAWAYLAEQALADGATITAYAYARTGYHRGLDQLRRNGWKGFGPVPFSHEPNQGFLRCVAVLARDSRRSGAAARIAEALNSRGGPPAANPVQPVVLAGDLCLPGLGLGAADRAWLSRNCRAVVHADRKSVV